MRTHACTYEHVRPWRWRLGIMPALLHMALLCLQILGVDQILPVEQFYFFKHTQLLSNSRVKNHTGRCSGELLALTWALSMLSVVSL